MFKRSKHKQVFDKAMANIICAVECKRRHVLPVTLSIQMILLPEYKDEIIPFSQLSLDLGVDYGIIKHCSDDEN